MAALLTPKSSLQSRCWTGCLRILSLLRDHPGTDRPALGRTHRDREQRQDTAAGAGRRCAGADQPGQHAAEPREVCVPVRLLMHVTSLTPGRASWARPSRFAAEQRRP